MDTATGLATPAERPNLGGVLITDGGLAASAGALLSAKSRTRVPDCSHGMLSWWRMQPTSALTAGDCAGEVGRWCIHWASRATGEIRNRDCLDMRDVLRAGIVARIAGSDQSPDPRAASHGTRPAGCGAFGPVTARRQRRLSLDGRRRGYLRFHDGHPCPSQNRKCWPLGVGGPLGQELVLPLEQRDPSCRDIARHERHEDRAGHISEKSLSSLRSWRGRTQSPAR